MRFPRRGCAPTAAPILHEHFAAMSPVASTEEENTATAQLFALDQALSPDTPLELAPPPVHPPQCLPLTMPAIAAVQGARNALWEDTSWFWFAGEALELPVSGPEIATPEPSRNRTRRLFRTPGKEKLRSFNLSTYRHVYKESLEPWIIPPRPALPRWIGEPVKFDWARLVARLADFEPKLPAVPPLGSAKDPELPTNPSMMVGSTTAGHTGMRRAQSALPYLGRVVQFWQAQSWFTRSLALAIPVLAFVALKPSFDGSLAEPVVLAKEMPAAQSTVIRRNPTRERKIVESKLPAATAVPAVAPAGAAGLPEAKVEPKLNQVDRMLLARAAVELADDFSFGLDSWDSRNGTAWTYDQTGFIRPRSLALYRPSMNLTDYSVQFLGKIDYAAIGWVVRAVDFNNYHAVKLVQRGGGPLPRYTIVRYSVVDGKEGPRIEHPLPLNLYKDTLFRIRMDIRGSDYAILVQDSVVDSWSDDRFPFGGVGFFSGRGEESRVRWVQVTYQNDLIGKICAWFAPRV
ncbi:hypothetical protein F183_A15310 [Bryobacterales bacterium F-183]|nr:hypothetical protein F183_A15310 [Bryobacterales bacterium F-183]